MSEPEMVGTDRVIIIQDADRVRVKRYLSPEEAADLLGFSESVLGLWRRQARGPVYSKIGKSVRYCLTDLEAFMASRKVRTISMAV
jgi:hypothetical protein